MKRLLIAAVFSVASLPALAEVNASVSIGQPGFYGTIDIGNFPRPRLIYAEPVYLRPVPYAYGVEPIYLRVPPGHERNWSKHCSRYGACGRPVYFVEHDWYEQVYVPRYREVHHLRHDVRHVDKHGYKQHPKHGKKHKD